MGNMQLHYFPIRNPPVGQGENRGIPAYVVPPYLHFTPGQLTELINAGQAPGVPFQIGTENAERALGERKRARLIDVSVNIRKNSIYLELLSGGRIAVAFSYDSVLATEFSLYIVAKDRSDVTKLRIAEARAVLGPFRASEGIGMKWESKNYDCPIEISMLTNSRKEESSHLYDMIIISKVLLKKRKSEDEISKAAVIFQASMCNLPRKGLAEKPVGSIAKISCAVQKIQTKSGVFKLEEVYGLETGIVIPGENIPVSNIQTSDENSKPSALEVPVPGKSEKIQASGKIAASAAVASGDGIEVVNQSADGADNDDNMEEDDAPTKTQDEASYDYNTAAGECVICLTDPRAVAMFPCRHFCLCMSCAEALPSQGNKCPICRNATYLLLNFQNKPEKAASRVA